MSFERDRPTRRWRWRPASLRGRVVVGVLVLVLVLLTGLFATVDALLGARLHADLRTRLTDRVSLAEQLDGALSPQQLVNRLRGDGVSALLCSPTSTSSTTNSTTAGSTPHCYSADTNPPPPTGGARPSGAPAGASNNNPAGSGNPLANGPVPGGRRAPPAARATTGSTAVESAGSVLYVRTTLPSTDQTLTLSVDSSQVGATIKRLLVLEVVGGLITLLVAALLLVRLVGKALRPLDDMTALARRIGAGDRGRRLGTGRSDTELGRTAAAFDDMLDELESALAGAAAAEARLRSFLSDVSHELRTPLTGLAATTETLLRAEPGQDAAAREQAYVTLVRETRRAGRLVDDLLTVTRLDTGMSLATESVDLVEVARHEVDRLHLLAPKLTTSVTAPPNVVVDGDPVRLGQIIANLLDNARTAAGPSGTITIDIANDGAAWLFEVGDSGPGVAPADRERIFDRLVRLDESRSRDRGGFGLGLPIARALARAHGGDLQCVEPVSGVGARFRLTLPARVGSMPSPDGQLLVASR